MTPQLTEEEIERMRAIVAAHDQQGGKPKEFDLNNPPTPPYVFKEFPRTLFRDGKLKIVASEHEQDLWLAKGWSVKPTAPEAPAAPIEIDAASAAEAAEIDRKIATQKRK